MTEKLLTNIKLWTPQQGWLVHPELRDRMIADAEAKSTNLGDLACQILAQRLGAPYTPVPRKSKPNADKTQFNFRMPESLEVTLAAATRGRKKADHIRAILCQHYGLEVPAKKKFTRNRTPRVAPAT
jgi:hypothetical protein